MMYVFERSENHLITHDGHVQLGSIHCSLDWFLENVKVPVTVVYWMPNAFLVLGIQEQTINVIWQLLVSVH